MICSDISCVRTQPACPCSFEMVPGPHTMPSSSVAGHVQPNYTATPSVTEHSWLCAVTILCAGGEVMRSNHWFETEISRVEFVALALTHAHLLGWTSLMVLAEPQRWPLRSSIATSPGRSSALAPAGSLLRRAPLAGRTRHVQKQKSFG